MHEHRSGNPMKPCVWYGLHHMKTDFFPIIAISLSQNLVRKLFLLQAVITDKYGVVQQDWDRGKLLISRDLKSFYCATSRTRCGGRSVGPSPQLILREQPKALFGGLGSRSTASEEKKTCQQENRARCDLATRKSLEKSKGPFCPGSLLRLFQWLIVRFLDRCCFL